MRIYYQNVRSIRGKLNQIKVSAATFSADYGIIVLTETRLNEAIYDSEIELGAFILYRDERSDLISSRGGGVLIAMRRSIKSKIPHTLDNSLISFNQLFIVLPDLKTVIGTVYIPPSSGISLYQEHLMHVEDIKNTFLDHNLVLVGDFNLPGISWSSTTSLKRDLVL